MQKGLSLQDLAAKIEANAQLKHDFVADTRNLTMQVQSDKTIVLESNETGDSYPVREIAHDQIGARLQIPAKYYDRMRASAPDLLATNVNAWFRQSPEKRMVRTLGGDCRAFLSNSYQRIENEEIAKVVLPILLNIPGVSVVSSEITERRLYIQAVTPRRAAVKVGDEVQAGVVISNSEVGHGSVSISPMIYRLVCLNGLITNDGRFRANHVGRRVEEGVLAAINYQDDTRAADDRAVLLKVRDHVNDAVSEIGFGQRVERMAALAQSREMKNPVKAMEVLARKIDISEGEGESILTAIIKGADLSAWGVVNAVTAQAHNESISYDRVVEFEAIGGKLLDLGKSEWNEILEAA